jgi:hypothetical protein
MTIEAVTHISDMDSSLPRSIDPRSEGDDHIRNCKRALKQTFPGATGLGFAKPITATEDELNRVAGVTAPVQEQLDALPGDYVATDAGDQEIGGKMIVKRFLDIEGVDDDSDLELRFYDTNRVAQGLLEIERVNAYLQMWQWGPGGAAHPADTILRLYEGRCQVFSNNGKNTDPVNNTDLVNLGYMNRSTVQEDAQGNVTITGLLTMQEEVRIIASTANAFDGLTIYGPSQTDPNIDTLRCSFYLDEAGDFLGISFFDALSNLDTFVKIKDGEMRIGNSVVRTFANTPSVMNTAAAGGVSGSFVDGAGKTVTVTDGLITDLG